MPARRGRRALPQPGRQPLHPGERLHARAVGVNALVAGSHWLTIAAMVVLAGLLLVAAQFTLFGWLAWAARRLGGALTGNTYGAACVLVELAVLIAAGWAGGAVGRRVRVERVATDLVRSQNLRTEN